MNAHQLDANGVIINTIVVDSLNVFPNLIDASLGGTAGDTWDGLLFTTPTIIPEDALKAVQTQRSSEYPPMADYLDGIVKGDTAQVQAYIDACLAVKAKYPKPE
jgi:hypothetical protein